MKAHIFGSAYRPDFARLVDYRNEDTTKYMCPDFQARHSKFVAP
jgi:hypothetical protein